MRSIIAGFARWREAVTKSYADDALEDGFFEEAKHWQARSRYWHRVDLWWSGLPDDAKDGADARARWPS